MVPLCTATWQVPAPPLTTGRHHKSQAMRVGVRHVGCTPHHPTGARAGLGQEKEHYLAAIKPQVGALISPLSDQNTVHPILRDVIYPCPWFSGAALSGVPGRLLSSLDHY